MLFGAALPPAHQMPHQPDWSRVDATDAILAIARRADALGYAWVPCSDHVVVPARAAPSMGTVWYEPATTLAFIAASTRRLRLLAHVVVLPYHSPLDVAKQYATLDRLSGGRVILGVGAGHLRAEFRALGASYERRGVILDEGIDAIKALWSSETASFEGAHVSFRDVCLAPRPVQQPRPPIWVGGNSGRAVRRAVERADGWVPFDVSFDDLRERLAYAQSLRAFGERATPIEVVIPAGPVELTGRPLDGERAPFTGSRDQVTEDIEEAHELGVTGMTVGFRARSVAEHLELMEQFAADVMAAVVP